MAGSVVASIVLVAIHSKAERHQQLQICVAPRP